MHSKAKNKSKPQTITCTNLYLEFHWSSPFHWPFHPQCNHLHTGKFWTSTTVGNLEYTPQTQSLFFAFPTKKGWTHNNIVNKATFEECSIDNIVSFTTMWKTTSAIVVYLKEIIKLQYDGHYRNIVECNDTPTDSPYTPHDPVINSKWARDSTIYVDIIFTLATDLWP